MDLSETVRAFLEQPRLGAQHWQTIAHQDRLGVHPHITSVQARGF